MLACSTRGEWARSTSMTLPESSLYLSKRGRTKTPWGQRRRAWPAGMAEWTPKRLAS